MSSRRSRSGGRWISTVLSRYSRSSRKRPAATSRAQVGVRRRDDAHVDAARARRADALDLAALQHAQQLRLLRQRHVADLVEEERAPVGELEAADAIGLRVGERALHVAEQLALEHALREPAHVHGDERLAGARARRVQPARDELLAGAVLAGDEHVRVRRADALHEAQHGLHRRAVGDDLDLRRRVAAERAVLALEPLRAAQRPAQLDLRAQRVRRAARCPTASRRSRARRAASPRPRPRCCPTRSSRRPAARRRAPAARGSRSSPSRPDVVSRV